jgi:hypothetical protein
VVGLLRDSPNAPPVGTVSLPFWREFDSCFLIHAGDLVKASGQEIDFQEEEVILPVNWRDCRLGVSWAEHRSKLYEGGCVSPQKPQFCHVFEGALPADHRWCRKTLYWLISQPSYSD